jgi:hypothetical protein
MESIEKVWRDVMRLKDNNENKVLKFMMWNYVVKKKWGSEIKIILKMGEEKN